MVLVFEVKVPYVGFEPDFAFMYATPTVAAVTEKVSEQTITLVLALTPHTIVAYVEVTANVPLAMEQGSKANCFEILYVWQIDY